MAGLPPQRDQQPPGYAGQTGGPGAQTGLAAQQPGRPSAPGVRPHFGGGFAQAPSGPLGRLPGGSGGLPEGLPGGPPPQGPGAGAPLRPPYPGAGGPASYGGAQQPGVRPPGAPVANGGPAMRSSYSGEQPRGLAPAGGGGGPPQPRAPPTFGQAPPPPGMFQPGGAQAPGFGAPGQAPAPGFLGAGGYSDAAAQAVLDHFEGLQLGPAAPGQPDPSSDPAYLPRPAGPEAEAAARPTPPYHKGNCDPRFIRLTTNAVPAQQSLRARFQLPLGAIVHPLADPQEDVPVIQLGPAGIVRCKRCRTYINPFMAWQDGGRRFLCNVCGCANDTPLEFQCALGPDGQRLDVQEHSEMACGSVEYIAPQEYMVRPPMPPAFFFVIDVSQAAVASGVLAHVCRAIRASLDRLPGGERTRVGFLTFDTALHFYNLKAGLSQPQMMVVAELSEPFVPLPDDLLVNLAESRGVVEALLDSLPSTFAVNTSVESAMGPALQAAFMVVSPIGGKLLLFQSAVPSLGVGRVKQRDNGALWGTDAEPKLRQPDDSFWKKYAAECSRVQIAIDVFIFCPSFIDVASFGALSRYTCGQLYYYPGFHPDRDGARVEAEVRHNLTRTTGWEAVMRIRCSKGLRISAFHGHFFIRSTDLLALPQVDPDKAFAVQVAHEEGVLTTSAAYMQCALLYTSSSGERRIRVHTVAFPVVQDVNELFRATDAAATAALLAKLAVEKSYSSKLDETRAAIQHKLSMALKEFRVMHAAASRGNLPHHQLIYPPSLRYLPVWTLGIMKSTALRGGKEVVTDERAAVGLEVMAASVPQLLRLLYPALYPVHDPAGDWGRPGPDGRVRLPPTVPLTGAYMSDAGAYLLDSGRIFVLWLGKRVPKDFISQVFAVDVSRPIPDNQVLKVEPALPGLELSARINAVLGRLRDQRGNYPTCFVVRQGTPPEQHVLPYLVEDRGLGTPSYQDFAVMLHRAVLSKA
ncbi:hypothetical protein WJX81_006860 [Elliptochloris bilobata]|uniref:Protein transport protein Sec24-like n=1 Tax=Elliptochloris bilobata TaxID=381761 RepID=A0AAW1R387_9CHLO